VTNQKKKLIVVLGPTAIGKTSLAIEAAQAVNTEIISADSRQFFKELNIGVARPSEKELLAVKHHFIAFISIEDRYSAGMFETDALNLLEQLFEKHDVVICCGGSMLYIDALINGLDDLPGDEAVRKTLQQELETLGLEHLQRKLKEVDEAYYRQVDLQNPHRLIRALEVCALTGKKYSDLRKANSANRPFDVVKIGLTSNREWLYNRINTRVDAMIESGLEQEAKSVLSMRHLNALHTVGYKEMFDYFDGELSLNDCIEKIKQHTRNFAKRQLTWWRKDADIHWIEVDKTNNALEEVLSIIEQA